MSLVGREGAGYDDVNANGSSNKAATLQNKIGASEEHFQSVQGGTTVIDGAWKKQSGQASAAWCHALDLLTRSGTCCF